MTKKTTEIILAADSPSTLERYVSQSTGVKSPRSDCKMCSCKLRDEAEAEYDRTGNFRAVWSLIKNKGVQISYPAVVNHLKYHYIPDTKLQGLTEYSKQVKQMMSSCPEYLDEMNERKAIINKIMFELASDIVGRSLDEQLKMSDMIKKMQDTLMALDGKILEETRKFEPINYLCATMGRIFKEKINAAKATKDSKAVNLLTEVYTELAEVAEEFSVPKKEK